MGNDMDKKGILTVRMMGTISVEYEGEFFPIGTALTGKILQLFMILCMQERREWAGKSC